MSIKVDQALIDTLIKANIGIDIVHENGVISEGAGWVFDEANGAYVPTSMRPYVDARVFQGDKEPFSLSDSDEVTGFYQCLVNYPIDQGAHIVKQKAEEILTAFKIGSVLSYDGQDVSITKTKRYSGEIANGSFYQIAVRIFFIAFTQRG